MIQAVVKVCINFVGRRFSWFSSQDWPNVHNKEIINWFGNVIIVRIILSFIRLSLIRVVLLPLSVSEFIIFQPILGSVALQASQYLPYFWYKYPVALQHIFYDSLCLSLLSLCQMWATVLMIDSHAGICLTGTWRSKIVLKSETSTLVRPGWIGQIG